MDFYWTHNTAYHSWIIKHIGRKDRVLDVGCGDGLLIQKLTGICDFITGLDPDIVTADKAKKRLKYTNNTSIHPVSFEQYDAKPNSFDAIIFVASLHHMNQKESIQKAKSLLVPGGKLIVVGCARPDGFCDMLFEFLRVIPAKIGSLIHGERNGGNIDVPIRKPDLSLAQIRETVALELPNVKIRRGLYYRYLMLWVK